ncbi:MAG TPA: FlgD immunoglobulin-like domain containing protein, partial [Bacteroidota bacterium]|nr:FlgD immunoglobulin-like domain containing protein [Bacteroidota bacterium]
TGGINVTNGSVTGGGTLHSIGDRIVVKGVVGQNRGTTQLNIINYPADVTLLDSGNVVTPKIISMDQYITDPETDESQLIKFMGVKKTATSPDWPALGAYSNMIITDGYRELVLRIDDDTDIDGTTEPVYPMDVRGVATQYTTSSGVYNDGYQISPNMYTDFTGGVNPPPNRYFALLAPANTSRIVLNDTAQTVTFRWNAAVDLNGDNVIYQWLPIGFPAVPTGTSAKDTFLVRTGKQLLTYLSTSDSVVLKWAVAAKDPTHPAVGSKDTLTVKLVRGTITGVDGLYEIPTRFALDQNYPNPFNPTTTIRFGLPSAASVRLTVYDALGREVTTLIDNEERAAGYVSVVWNGQNSSGARVASGVYFYRIQAQPAGGGVPFVELKKMVLVK